MSRHRIPPSLAWLIRNQRVTAGLIRRVEKALSKLESEIKKAHQTIQLEQNLNAQITKLKDDLVAIEHSMRMHEIQIDPEKLKPLNPHSNPSLFKYGELTRLIYSALNQEPQEWLSTTEVVMHIVSHATFKVPEPPMNLIRLRVRKRLETLAYQGKIYRELSKNDLVKEWLWRQNPS